MKIKGSFLFATFLAVGLGAWMYTGEIKLGGKSDSGEGAEPIAEREAEKSNELFKVRYVAVSPQKRTEVIGVRGRTMADAIVSVRSETGGILKKRLVNKGDAVKAGDLVCVIEDGTRQTKVTQARAQLAQATSEYESNLELKKKGFAANNRITQLKAALDGAKASFAEAEQELERVNVRANATGIVQDPIAKIGDVMSVGALCVTLTDTDPMLFTGQVPELKIDQLSIGMNAKVELVTGQKIDGKIRYISSVADANTRTFQIEVELEKGKNVRDGMTARANISLDGGMAFNISPSWMTLSDDGEIGVRIVSTDNIVQFVPLKIISQNQEGFWVTGLSDKARIITLGQEYVSAGEKVDAIVDSRSLDTTNKTSAIVGVANHETAK